MRSSNYYHIFTHVIRSRSERGIKLDIVHHSVEAHNQPYALLCRLVDIPEFCFDDWTTETDLQTSSMSLSLLFFTVASDGAMCD